MSSRATVSKRKIEQSETILEYVLDGLTPIPPLLKRNLSHISTLQKTCDTLHSKLTPLETTYLEESLRKIKDFPFPKDKDSNVPIPTTEELESVISSPSTLTSITTLQSTLLSLSREKVDTAQHILEYVDEHVKGIDEEIKVMEGQLKEEGYFEPAGASAGDRVALLLDPTSPLSWILGCVISYVPETGMYRISDSDPDVLNKVYNLSKSQVKLLNLQPNQINKSDDVMAVYPDTTSFYPAKVEGVRKVGGGNVVYVVFKDDQDEMGVTHEKPVLLKHVMKL
ncbi:hypothetical protein TrVE_jg346 [Triparma verrucosa]|uniref:SGF29 C-terminal domain-containing protein n=2 Tax=Triparma TaxID=722752 RepID=A0A9W7ABC0_9STRA|nr:hypothetical protein TrST_g4472 [Triparma strigata]GMH99696.1 hypothetical protein TrVE_jg346 [Triparma verrucosa]